MTIKCKQKTNYNKNQQKGRLNILPLESHLNIVNEERIPNHKK